MVTVEATTVIVRKETSSSLKLSETTFFDTILNGNDHWFLEISRSVWLSLF